MDVGIRGVALSLGDLVGSSLFPASRSIGELLLSGGDSVALGTGPSDFEALLSGGLGDQFGVVALDPRGLGGSSSVERTYPLNFYLRDALDGAAAMAQLGHDKYSVLGWSDGANSALQLASHPSTKQAVDKLVVWGGNSYVTQEDVDAWEALRDISNWSERIRTEKAKQVGGLDRLQELNSAASDGWIRLYTENAGDVCLEALHQYPDEGHH